MNINKEKRLRMGAEAEMIPYLDLSHLEEGSENWKAMSKKVREACESYGFFVLKYDDIPTSLREEMLMNMKMLFDLPEETKHKHTSPKPYRSYHEKCSVIPFCQSFGIDDAPLPETAKAFTDLMWPKGNPSFCKTLNWVSTKMLELCFVIHKMIVQGLGLPDKYGSDVEIMNSSSNFRLIKYRVPPCDKQSEPSLVPHTDQNTLTVLCQNEVQGLQVLTNQGNWIQLNIPKEAFVVIVGDMLKAWSNGRLRAVKHKVVMSGEKERYTFGQFSMPNEEAKIEVPRELVDQDHPLLYCPFKYGEYFNFYTSALDENALQLFAGL